MKIRNTIKDAEEKFFTLVVAMATPGNLEQ
jgi:hypothetical protein